jgi:hypothetical protein
MDSPRHAPSLYRCARRLRRLLPVVLCALCLAGSAAADVVVLKGGRRVEGKVIAEDGKTVRVRTAFGELEFPRADVVKIERGETAR